ncbi:MAG TPA: ribosome silencing factor [bacterium]|nr:ribosome silencing factor [bacterium]
MEIVRGAMQAAEDKKATNPVVVHIGEISAFADYFLVCSADTRIQLNAICDQIQKALGSQGLYPSHVEGYGQSGWVLMDYGTVIVHVFLEHLRSYYALEDLWGDARRVNLREPDR